MATFQSHLQNAKKLKANKLSNDLFKYIRSIESEIIEKNINQIKIESKDVNDKPIGFYSYATDMITGGKKRRGDPFTGFDTGEWMDGFFMQEVAGVLRFGSSDPKTNDILSSPHWLSDDLFGLSDKDLKDVINQRLHPFFVQNVRDILNI